MQKLKNLYQNPKFSERGAYEAIKKYGPKAFNWLKGGVGSLLTRFPGLTQLGAYYTAATPTKIDKKYGITHKENIIPMFGSDEDRMAGFKKKVKRNIEEEKNPNNPWRYDFWKYGPAKDHPDYDPEERSWNPWHKGAPPKVDDLTGTKEIITETGVPGGGDKDMTYTDPDKAAKLAKAAQNKRLKSYLDMMGYDQAKKGALSKALIDASAIVQQGTEEAGSLKEADWGKLINQAIQTTSRRLEKPEQIREAVGLMATKAAIEKDLEDPQVKALRALEIQTKEKGLDPSPADLALAAAGKTGKVSQDILENIVRSTEGVENFKASFKDKKGTAYGEWLDDNKNGSEMKFMKDVVSQESDFGAGVYVFPYRVVEVKDDLTMSWWH